MTRAADRVKELIVDAKRHGLTKRKIAKAMGITPQHLSNLLGGKNEWKLTHVESLCEVLEISLAEAFLETGEDIELFILLKKILDRFPSELSSIRRKGLMTRRHPRGGGVEEAKFKSQKKIHGPFKAAMMAGQLAD